MGEDPAAEDEEEGEKGKEREVSGRTIFVKNVIEERRIKFFRRPQIGGLLIVPIKDGRQDIKGVISMDTLGQGFKDPFTSDQTKLAEDIAVSFGINYDRLIRAREEEDKEALQTAYDDKAKDLEARLAEVPADIPEQE